MSEGTKTLTFAGVALGLLVVAVVTRPRAPHPSQLVQAGGVLNDVADPLTATRLEVIKYDEDTSSIKTFEVAQIDGMWVIPSHQDYPADADRQMADAATSVMNLKILGVISANPGDHATYGVVDPDVEKLTPGAIGVGTRVNMQDQADRKLVAMVIGKKVKDQEGQRYVRKVGQDPVYVVKLDPDKLSTRFEDWIEDDLLKLNPWDIQDVTLKDYSVELGLGAAGLSILWDQRAEMEFTYDDSNSKWTAKELKVFDQQKKDFQTVALAEDEEVNTDKLNDLKTALDDLKIVDVERKPEGLSRDLKAEKDFATNREAVQNLATRGFMPVQVGQDSFEILSTDGEVLCRMKDGVEYVLRFGKLVLGSESAPEKKADSKGEATQDESSTTDAAAKEEGEKKDSAEGTSEINRYIFVTARFDEGAIAKPEIEDLPQLPAAAAQEAGAEANQAAGTEKEATDAKEEAANDAASTNDAASGDAGGAKAPEGDGDPSAGKNGTPEQDATKDETPNEEAAADDGASDTSDDKARDDKPAEKEADGTAADDTQPADAEADRQEAADAEQEAAAGAKADDAAADTAADGEKKDADAAAPAGEKTGKETLEDLIERRKTIEKENQRKLDEYQEKLKKAKDRVKELNERFGDWYYVISDTVFKKIHLGRDDVIKKKEKEEEKDKGKDDGDEAGSTGPMDNAEGRDAKAEK